jgi:hypothetical protein
MLPTNAYHITVYDELNLISYLRIFVEEKMSWIARKGEEIIWEKETQFYNFKIQRLFRQYNINL